MTWNKTNTPGVIYVGEVNDIPLALQIPQPNKQELMSDAVTRRIHAYLHKSGTYQSHEGHENLKRWRNCEHENIKKLEYVDMFIGPDGVSEQDKTSHLCLDCGFDYAEGE